MRADARVIDESTPLRWQHPLTQVLRSHKHMLHHIGFGAARCTVERVMRKMGWHAGLEEEVPRTTTPNPDHHRPPDLVDRYFYAATSNRLCVADVPITAPWAAGRIPPSSPIVFSRGSVRLKVDPTMASVSCRSG